MQYTRAPYGVN